MAIELKTGQTTRVNRQQYDHIMGTIDDRGRWAFTTFGRIDKRGQCFIKPATRDCRRDIEKYLNRK